MQTYHFEGHVFGPSNDEPAIVAPSNSCDLLAVQVAVLFVKHERGECFCVRRGFKYFGLGAASHKEEL